MNDWRTTAKSTVKYCRVPGYRSGARLSIDASHIYIVVKPARVYVKDLSIFVLIVDIFHVSNQAELQEVASS